ncbi:unnamed protein product [Trichobilharzia regenti]|nr:unnamed protein product [Trichobilharzia regenti]
MSKIFEVRVENIKYNNNNSNNNNNNRNNIKFVSNDEFGCQYKHFTIYLNFAHIPNIKQLIKETSELDGGTGVGGSTLLRSFLMEDSFKAYVFVRFQFPNYGTQMSQLVYLPNSTDQFDDLKPTTIIEVNI